MKNITEEAAEEKAEGSEKGDRGKEEKMTKRARGGGLDAAMEHKKMLPDRKKGGRMHGKASKSRPDRRARGGGVTSDMHPETAAGNMTSPDYEGKKGLDNEGGKGSDMSPYKGGSHRRPG